MKRTIVNLKISYFLREYETEIGALFEDKDELFDITEMIEIDREKRSIVLTTKTASVNYKKFEYQDIDGVDELLDDIEEVEDKIVKNYKSQDYDLKTTEFYEICVTYDKGKNRIFKGCYTRLNLPKNYLSVIDKIKYFIYDEIHSINIFMPKWQYESELKDDEYYCVGVTFDYSDKIYYYKTKEHNVRGGYTVLVPAGKSEATAFVILLYSSACSPTR